MAADLALVDRATAIRLSGDGYQADQVLGLLRYLTTQGVQGAGPFPSHALRGRGLLPPAVGRLWLYRGGYGRLDEVPLGKP